MVGSPFRAFMRASFRGPVLLVSNAFPCLSKLDEPLAAR